MFKSAVLKDFCNNLGIELVFCPVGDHCGCGLVKRTIQTIKRKLRTKTLSRLFYKGLNHVLHTFWMISGNLNTQLAKFLAKRTTASRKGARAGQTPRKIAPKSSASLQFPKCPISIVPATNRGTAGPRWFSCQVPTLQMRSYKRTHLGGLLEICQLLAGQRGPGQLLLNRSRQKI